jgi:hypothetical protein
MAVARLFAANLQRQTSLNHVSQVRSPVASQGLHLTAPGPFFE